MAKYLLDLYLDGYDSDDEQDEACDEFVYEQLNFTASGVHYKRITDVQYDEFMKQAGETK